MDRALTDRVASARCRQPAAAGFAVANHEAAPDASREATAKAQLPERRVDGKMAGVMAPR
eukprot:2230715-Prorocentrum_lima.AAC.1